MQPNVVFTVCFARPLLRVEGEPIAPALATDGRRRCGLAHCLRPRCGRPHLRVVGICAQPSGAVRRFTIGRAFQREAHFVRCGAAGADETSGAAGGGALLCVRGRCEDASPSALPPLACGRLWAVSGDVFLLRATDGFLTICSRAFGTATVPHSGYGGAGRHAVVRVRLRWGTRRCQTLCRSTGALEEGGLLCVAEPCRGRCDGGCLLPDHQRGRS